MELWQKILAESIISVDEVAARFQLQRPELNEVALTYPLRVTPYYLGLIRYPGDPIWRQCVPDLEELEDESQVPDPLHEENLSPVPGLIHRYPDRVVWTVSNACAVYCRFCMRKRHVGCALPAPPVDKEIVAYIEEHQDIREVLLSGGEPLLLDDERIEEVLQKLRAIPHVEIIRLHTRVPVTLPERITPRLCSILKRFHPLYVNTHFNHPWEITERSAKACAMLADAGLPLGNQTVLLRGVNDDPAVMKRLMEHLLAIRVRPYYIHQMDLVKGTAHFRTSVREGLAIMEALRGHTSGLANPHYVIDLPGGKGKVSLLPDNVAFSGDMLTIRTFRGDIVEYRDLAPDSSVSSREMK